MGVDGMGLVQGHVGTLTPIRERKGTSVMLRIRRKAGMGVATIVALGSVAGIGIASGSILSHSSKPRSRGTSVPLSHSVVRQIAANRSVLARSFRVFHKANVSSAAGGHALPATFAKKLAQQATDPVPQGGLAEPDPSMATFVGAVTTAARGTLNVWAIPGANDLCIAEVPSTNKGGSDECASDQDAAAGKLIGADEGSGNSSTVIGLLPGSPASVTVHHSSGANGQLPVTNGLWVLNDDRQAVSVSASGVNGSIPIPTLPGSSR